LILLACLHIQRWCTTLRCAWDTKEVLSHTLLEFFEYKSSVIWPVISFFSLVALWKVHNIRVLHALSSFPASKRTTRFRFYFQIEYSNDEILGMLSLAEATCGKNYWHWIKLYAFNLHVWLVSSNSYAFFWTREPFITHCIKEFGIQLVAIINNNRKRAFFLAILSLNHA